MTNEEFVKKLKNVLNYKTLYVIGCFGAPMTSKNKTRYINNGSHEGYNSRPERKAMITSATDDTFGFDCVCLIKGVLWGWNGDKTKNYGGAVYASNGVPDIGADSIINVCKNISTDFNKIEVGELLWTPGHVGIYIGDGLAIECTPAWKNGVQITACNRNVSGYNRRNWKKHGKLPYITYNKNKLDTGTEIVKALVNTHKVEINEREKAIKAIDKAKSNSDFNSLYWILYKLVNGNG